MKIPSFAAVRRSPLILAATLPFAIVTCSDDTPPSRAESAGGAAGDAATSGGTSAGASEVGGAPNDAVAQGGAAGAAGEDMTPGNAGEAAYSAGGEAGATAVDLSQPPSCQAPRAALRTCGPSSESCCTSLALPGQSFYLSYDGVSPGYQDKSHSASVTAFRLDKFEVTVGRFREFVAAVVGSWRPKGGSGRHAHLNQGKGLMNVGPDAGSESGWDETWSSGLANDLAEWNTRLDCDPEASTWTPKEGRNEKLPVSCVDWYEAYAFCIWDEGFLPSEAEWNDAASGGDQQRVFPWSSPPASQTIDCLHANHHGAAGPDYCVAPGKGAATTVGAESPLGDGRWGHADLAGNVFEWALDSFAPYVSHCPDCVYWANVPNQVMRGGGYTNDRDALLSSARNANSPSSRSPSLGVRCARSP